MNQHQISHTQIWLIAWPIILSNLSTPLLGLVDTAVIGNLGDPALIGAIAIGGMIFSFLYWGFGFLRMGTTGLVAQARGSGRYSEARAAFYRALLVGGAIGLTLVILQSPIIDLSLLLIEGSVEVEQAARTYFQIRIWGAPFSLGYLAVLGYLLGQQASRSILFIQLLLNCTNILLDIILVTVFDFGVGGVAAATVIAEILAMCVGLYLVAKQMSTANQGLWVSTVLLKERSALKRMFLVNRDIMVRTLCLIFAFAWFTNEGAKAGDVLLACNAILMQFVTFSAFFLDGFALAAESLVGSAVGAKNVAQLKSVIRRTSELGLGTAVILSLLFVITGQSVVNLLTNVTAVQQATSIYFPWVVAAPALSVWCYVLDGVFIGATKTVEMRNAMVISLGVYLLSWWLLSQSFANHGLWASLMIYFVARALTLYRYLPQMTR